MFHDAIARWAPNPVMQEVVLPGAIATVEFANCSTLDTPYRTLGVEPRAAAIERGTSVSRDGPTATSDGAIIPLG